MKQLTVAVLAIVALLTLAAPFVLAEDKPNDPPPGGGCSGSDCR